jgi:tetratricopeptide (TPR) repeat protein
MEVITSIVFFGTCAWIAIAILLNLEMFPSGEYCPRCKGRLKYPQATCPRCSFHAAGFYHEIEKHPFFGWRRVIAWLLLIGGGIGLLWGMATEAASAVWVSSLIMVGTGVISLGLSRRAASRAEKWRNCTPPERSEPSTHIARAMKSFVDGLKEWYAIWLGRRARRAINFGRLDKAQQCNRKALWTMASAFGHTPQTAVYALNLAEVLVQRRQFAEATEHYLYVLEVPETTPLQEKEVVVGRLITLAFMLGEEKRYAEAEEYLRQAMPACEAALGPNHVEVGAAYQNLGMALRWQGRCEEAAPLLRRCLTIWEKALPPDHVDLGMVLRNLAGVHQELGKLEDAERLFQRALSILKAVLAPNDPGLVMVQAELSSVRAMISDLP